MIITKEWLEEQRACVEGIDWFVSQSETDGIVVVKKLITENRLDWANWLIVRIMEYPQYVAYAVFAAEQVIDIFERKYPDDKRPRNAIEAAKNLIKNPSIENKQAAYSAYLAAYAADAAAYAADAAYAAYAADAADAAYAAYAAYSAYSADAADSASSAYAADAIKTKILNYGIKLLEGK